MEQGILGNAVILVICIQKVLGSGRANVITASYLPFLPRETASKWSDKAFLIDCLVGGQEGCHFIKAFMMGLLSKILFM